MSKPGHIVEGFFNNLINKNESLFEERISTCRECKLIIQDDIFGEVCNPSLYLNVNTNQISSKPKIGFKNGCGCVLRAKARVLAEECPLGKWKDKLV